MYIAESHVPEVGLIYSGAKGVNRQFFNRSILLKRVTMKSMNLVRLLSVLIVSSACYTANGERDYSALLETIGLYFYSP